MFPLVGQKRSFSTYSNKYGPTNNYYGSNFPQPQSKKFRYNKYGGQQWKSSGTVNKYVTSSNNTNQVQPVFQVSTAPGINTAFNSNMSSRGVLGQEVKFRDYNYSNTVDGVQRNAVPLTFTNPLNVAETSKALNGIPVGTGANNRVGKQIALKSIFIRASLSHNTDPFVITRLVCYIDTQNNGVDPPGNYLPLITPANANQSFILSYLDLTRSGRYKIIMDEIVYCPAANAVQNPTFSKFHEFKKPLICDYSGVDSLATAISNNAIYFKVFQDGVVTNTAASANALTNLNISVRVRYYDS